MAAKGLKQRISNVARNILGTMVEPHIATTDQE